MTSTSLSNVTESPQVLLIIVCIHATISLCTYAGWESSCTTEVDELAMCLALV